MHKIIRITTVPVSLLILLKNQLRFMSKYFEVIAVSSGGKLLDQVKNDAGVKVKAIDMTRKITPVKDLRALQNLVKLMRLEKPLIVHTHTPKAGLLGMIAAKIAGVPIRLHTVAGLPLLERTGLQRQILNLTEKLTYACATNVYPNSAQMLKIILENKFCGKDKLKVIGKGSSNGIDTTYFDPSIYNKNELVTYRKNLNIEETDFVYCFIGRVVADKGIHELVDAFINIYKENRNIKLLLVGPFEKDLDPLDKKTETLISNHPGIRWVDYQQDVRPFLAISDVFTFPSYREGFPNVVMQAGAMGVPCIVSDINGCNEIIEHGKNGLIVPVKNIIDLQRAMYTLLKNNEVRGKLASFSRRAIVSRFENVYVMNELLKEYELLINNVPSLDKSASKSYSLDKVQ